MNAANPVTRPYRPLHWLAFGFGSGLAPKAPGTFGTLAAVPFALALLQLPWWGFIACVSLATWAGVYICGRTAKDLGVHDHPGIVWDEFVGYWITLAFMPSGWWWLAAGFVAFRFFDIIKPWPIRWVDRHVGGGLGIMLDDVLAGFMALACLQLAAALIGMN